jgi:hypothetical protein
MDTTMVLNDVVRLVMEDVRLGDSYSAAFAVAMCPPGSIVVVLVDDDEGGWDEVPMLTDEARDALDAYAESEAA